MLCLFFLFFSSCHTVGCQHKLMGVSAVFMYMALLVLFLVHFESPRSPKLVLGAALCCRFMSSGVFGAPVGLVLGANVCPRAHVLDFCFGPLFCVSREVKYVIALVSWGLTLEPFGPTSGHFCSILVPRSEGFLYLKLLCRRCEALGTIWCPFVCFFCMISAGRQYICPKHECPILLLGRWAPVSVCVSGACSL